MEFGKNTLIEYFKYDLEKLLDEFNNYYILKAPKIPLHIQALYLYFSHLAENSLQLLLNSKYNINQAIDIVNIPSIYIKAHSVEEINIFLQKNRINIKHFYGLAGFSLFFFESFLQYVKYNNESGIMTIFKNIPYVEHNLTLIYDMIQKMSPRVGNT